MLSLIKATAQPPHPAPVSLAPSAPFSLHVLTNSSSSGQLKKEAKRRLKTYLRKSSVSKTEVYDNVLSVKNIKIK